LDTLLSVFYLHNVKQKATMILTLLGAQKLKCHIAHEKTFSLPIFDMDW